MDDKTKKSEPLSGTPGMENQCKATFTLELPDGAYLTFRCMRKKHDDGKHEHTDISLNGWEYRVCWDEPKSAIINTDEVFTGKASREVQ